MAAPAPTPVKQVESYVIFNNDADASELAKLVTLFASSNEHKHYLLPKFRVDDRVIKSFRVRINTNFYDADDASCALPFVRIARTKVMTNGSDDNEGSKPIVQSIAFCPGEHMRNFLAAIVQRVYDECFAPEAQASIDLQASLQFLADPAYEMMVSVDSPRVFDLYAPEEVENSPDERRIQQRPVVELKSVVLRPIPNHPQHKQYIAVNTRLQYPIKETTRKQAAERRGNGVRTTTSIAFATNVPRIPAKRKAVADAATSTRESPVATQDPDPIQTNDNGDGNHIMVEIPMPKPRKLKRAKNVGK